LVKMRTTSSTLFVRVNTGVTENAGLENTNIYHGWWRRHGGGLYGG